MALNAVHIRARSLSPDGNDDHDAGQRRSEAEASAPSSPRWPARPSRPGLGSTLTSSHTETENDDSWHSLRTGESLATKALRMRDRFVRATHLSDPTLSSRNEASTSQADSPTQATIEPTQASISQAAVSVDQTGAARATLAQLYSQLAQDMTLSVPQRKPEPVAISNPLSHLDSPDSGPSHRNAEQERHHVHHHRHQPDARHKSEWFISRALTKMRRSQHASSSRTSTSADATRRVDPVDNSQDSSQASSQVKSSRCPRCGETLPPHATPEYMARHRQSIGHRLGLNAPVSSASASEAPSPEPSQPPTPATRSRSSSPTPPASLLNAPVRPLRRHSDKLPRRLSQAPRWKKISRDNVGHSLLSRMGWKEGMGLGVQEWKWQQLCHDKEKRQRSGAVKALLQRRLSRSAAVNDHSSASGTGIFEHDLQQAETTAASEESEWLQLLLAQQITGPSPASSVQTAFPFEHGDQTLEQQREAAQLWLSNLPEPDAEWFQSLSLKEQDSLQQALLSGQITLQDIQEALWSHLEATASNTAPANATTAGVDDDPMQSNALLYPVEVELRSDRSGIGVKRPIANAESSDLQRRRSRTAEGSVEIRRQLLTDASEGSVKKLRPSSTSRPFKSPSRSRSRSGTGSTDLTRRQREQAHQREKRDWLELRASLS
ncbi:conserved hypothetical protein [Sporisorium reilianum SRZ2]|uniref:G-patch domain-containing protein n=1 Tax=Sporisorium reilianum (strain SRZ2) TaxID=999809 RepID=E6ZWY7_SPORE|nr:conserved hypothetical protein [Sporisorium reilianum SRZ2]